MAVVVVAVGGGDGGGGGGGGGGGTGRVGYVGWGIVVGGEPYRGGARHIKTAPSAPLAGCGAAVAIPWAASP